MLCTDKRAEGPHSACLSQTRQASCPSACEPRRRVPPSLKLWRTAVALAKAVDRPASPGCGAMRACFRASWWSIAPVVGGDDGGSKVEHNRDDRSAPHAHAHSGSRRCWPPGERPLCRGLAEARVVARGMESAVAFVPDPVVPDTAVVVLQDGLVRVIRGGVVQETPLLDLREVISRGGERGLLGLAFPPDAAASLRVFVTRGDGCGSTRRRCGRIGRKRQAEEPVRAPAADDLPEVEERGLLHDAGPDNADQAILRTTTAVSQAPPGPAQTPPADSMHGRPTRASARPRREGARQEASSDKNRSERAHEVPTNHPYCAQPSSRHRHRRRARAIDHHEA